MSQLSIGQRLAAGFGIAVVILLAMAWYCYAGLARLAELRNHGAASAHEAMEIAKINSDVPRFSQIIGDAEINRELATTLPQWQTARRAFEAELDRTERMVTTERDRNNVAEARRAYQQIVALFESEMLPLLRQSSELTPAIRELDGRIDRSIAMVTEHYDAIAASLTAEVAADDASFDAERTGTIRVMAILAAVSVVLLCGISLVITRGIIVPVAGMTEAMRRLAQGDHSVEVPARDRKDEIGVMAGALETFKDNIVEMERLRQDQEAAKERAAGEQRAALRRVADDFDAGVGEAIQAISGATAALRESAQTMAASAEQTSRQSDAMAAAADRAGGNVQTVAAAAEQLSGSIAEIAQQVTLSSEISRQAVEEGEGADAKVQGLTRAAARITEVVKLITVIAEQTNLLALNATIEAARAGEAGKGFAVVASEVKMLANQTAKATEEIAAHISEMQQVTADTAGAIQRIGGTITRMNEITATIAAAVEQQGAATREIARNVREASAGTGEVTSNITEVSRAAQGAGSAARQVLAAADDLARQADGMRSKVGAFLTRVRES